jgi:hypothetical protein
MGRRRPSDQGKRIDIVSSGDGFLPEQTRITNALRLGTFRFDLGPFAFGL